MTDRSFLGVTGIRVEKLFGRYNHEVPLKTGDRVTIIHGPNGVGKTALLRLVSASLTGNVLELVKVPFSRFELRLSDGSVFGFEQVDDSETRDRRQQSPGDVSLTAFLERPGERKSAMLQTNQSEIRKLAVQIERESPWLSRLDDDRFIDRRTEEYLSSADVLTRYSELIQSRSPKLKLFEEPEWLSSIREKVGVHLIEAQRLLRFPGRAWDWEYRRAPEIFVPTVKSYAKDLQLRISSTLTAYAKQSQSLDQTFPQRLLQSAVEVLSVSVLKDRMKDLEGKRDQLKRIGLIEDESDYPFDIAALDQLELTRRTVMTLYVDDTRTKLGVLDDLSVRIEILLSHINRKFAHKEIVIDRERGLTARTEDGKLLELDALSSGEQHELVLLYDLLFRVKPNTLVLVDEPELSLHVTWQKTFLPDLLEVVATTGYDVLLATHSPFIVGDRSDLMVALTTATDANS